MGLLEQEIKELRDLQKKVYSGEVSLDTAAMHLAVANQISKRETLIYNLIALEAKTSKKVMRAAQQVNLIGTGTAIDVSGEEALACPEQGGKVIGREECLDYSGSEQHINECQNCPNFSTTRKALLP